MSVILKSGWLTIDKVIKPTQADFFSNLKEGDKIMCEAVVRNYSKHHGTYAPEITVTDTVGNKCYTTFSHLSNRLENFILK